LAQARARRHVFIRMSREIDQEFRTPREAITDTRSLDKIQKQPLPHVETMAR
jgi:hypothetical protein